LPGTDYQSRSFAYKKFLDTTFWTTLDNGNSRRSTSSPFAGEVGSAESGPKQRAEAKRDFFLLKDVQFAVPAPDSSEGWLNSSKVISTEKQDARVGRR
jgi:hypothetical protein